jgi:hypothetical protein
MKEDLKNLTFQLNQNKGKRKEKLFGVHYAEQKDTIRTIQLLRSTWKQGLQTPCQQEDHVLSKSSYCNIFFKSMDHDDKDCRML